MTQEAKLEVTKMLVKQLRQLWGGHVQCMIHGEVELHPSSDFELVDGYDYRCLQYPFLGYTEPVSISIFPKHAGN